MAPSIAHLEAILCEGYREEIDLYTQAIALCEVQRAAPQTPVESWLPLLLGLLDRVAAVEGRIAAAKADWRRQDRSAGAALAGCLNRMAELLRTLAAAVDGVIAGLQARREQLPAQLEALARSQRVQQAYQRVARAS